MKSFLEEYGFAILAAIVIIILILMLSPIGVKIENGINSIILNFDSSATSALQSAKMDDVLDESEPSEKVCKGGRCTGDLYVNEAVDGPYYFIYVNDIQDDQYIVRNLIIRDGYVVYEQDVTGEDHMFGDKVSEDYEYTLYGGDILNVVHVGDYVYASWNYTISSIDAVNRTFEVITEVDKNFNWISEVESSAQYPIDKLLYKNVYYQAEGQEWIFKFPLNEMTYVNYDHPEYLGEGYEEYVYMTTGGLYYDE